MSLGMTLIPRITDGKQMVMQNFFLGVGGGGGRGVVNKVHHDECENGDKAAAVCTIRVSTTLKHSASSSFKISTQKVYSQFEIDHLFKAIVLPNLVYGLSTYGAFEAQLSIGQCSAEIRWGGGAVIHPDPDPEIVRGGGA